MAFERWQRQLFDLLVAAETRRRQYDQAADACRLLLKPSCPWPKILEEVNGKDTESTPEDQIEMTCGSHINVQEEAELKLVSDLLSKAQKTRVKSVSKQPKKDLTTAAELATAGIESSQNVKVLPQAITHTSRHKETALTKTDEILQHGIPQKASKISEYYQNKYHYQQSDAALNALDSRSAKIKHIPALCQSKSKWTPDMKRLKTKASAQGLKYARPGSCLGKIKAAHVIAPFKTDPNLHVPRRNARKIVPSMTQSNFGKNDIHAGKSKSHNKVLPPVFCDKDLSGSSVSAISCQEFFNSPVPSKGEEFSTSNEEPELNLESLSSEISTMKVSEQPARHICDKIKETRAALPEKSASSKKSPQQEQDTNSFCLMTHGSRMNIPFKVKCALKKNLQLRSKLSQRKHLSRDFDIGQNFVNKLQEQFDAEEELLCRQQALECLNIHRLLTEMLQNLTLDQLSDTTKPQDVLRAKTLVEFVLSVFSKYSEDVRLLTQVHFQATSPVREPSYSQAQQNLFWLSDSLQEHGHLSDIKLQYTALRDLQVYIDLSLQIWTLQCQQHLVHLLAADILLCLEKMDQSEADFAAVFRGIFSLLTANGNHFPALIDGSFKQMDL